MSADERLIPLTTREPTPAAGPPVFERVGIVGLGLIGGSIALAARRAWPSALVIGVDRNEVVEAAVARHAIDVAAADLTIVSEADLIVLAAPVRENLALLESLPDYIDKPAIVTDVGSTKRAMMAAAAALPAHLVFVGGHPLGGATAQGIEAARADLFAGRPWLYTPPAAGHDEVLARLFKFAEGLGAVPHAIEADRHDRLMAFLSHLPQLAASALMQVVGDAAGEEGLALSGRGLQDTTRLAASPAAIWTDICATNADDIGPAIDALVSVLRQARENLDRADALGRLFEAANRWRAVLTDKRLP